MKRGVESMSMSDKNGERALLEISFSSVNNGNGHYILNDGSVVIIFEDVDL